MLDTPKTKANVFKATGRAIIIAVNWIDEKGPFVTAIATVFIAILTGIYVHYSHSQWKVMRSQAKTADATLKQIQYEDRPWITVKTVHPTLIEADKQIQGVIVITNSGKSPAFDTTSDVTMFVTTDSSLDVDPLTGQPEGDGVRDVVGPNVEPFLSVHSKDKPTSVQIEKLKQPDARYYFYGIITYRDNVTVHRTEFCYYTFSGLNGMNGCVGKRYKNTAD